MALWYVLKRILSLWILIIRLPELIYFSVEKLNRCAKLPKKNWHMDFIVVAAAVIAVEKVLAIVEIAAPTVAMAAVVAVVIDSLKKEILQAGNYDNSSPVLFLV